MSRCDSRDGQDEIRIHGVEDFRFEISNLEIQISNPELFSSCPSCRFNPVHPVILSSLSIQLATKRLLLNLSPPSSHARAIRKPVSAASAESPAGSYL